MTLQCYCTLDEFLDGHRHHCPDHEICFDCRCPSVSPAPFGFQCSLPDEHDGIHIDDTNIVTWD